jgi:peptidoglycan-associated lipoprotein
MRSRTIFTTVLILSCLVLASGCRGRKKQTPTTGADLPITTTAAAPEPAPAPNPEPDMAAPAPEPDPLDGDLESVNEYLRRQGLLGDAYFDYDRAELSEEAREQLAKNARFLTQYPRFALTLEGHCDERGTDEYNLALGERRAQSAKSYMVALGVPASRLTTISYGEERPVCSETEESCWHQNRRAHPAVTGRNDG